MTEFWLLFHQPCCAVPPWLNSRLYKCSSWHGSVSLGYENQDVSLLKGRSRPRVNHLTGIHRADTIILSNLLFFVSLPFLDFEQMICLHTLLQSIGHMRCLFGFKHLKAHFRVIPQSMPQALILQWEADSNWLQILS